MKRNVIKLNEKDLTRIIESVINEMADKLICYHGSSNDFDSFDPAYFGSSAGMAYADGVYVTPNKEVALSYGKNIYTVTIPNDMSKYLDVDSEVSKKIVLSVKNKLFKILTSSSGDYEGVEDMLKKELNKTPNKMSGTQLMTFISAYLDDEDMISLLRSLGIIGMVRPDEEAFVIFNPKDIEIIKKDIVDK